MEQTYALLDENNAALNFVVWDGVTEFDYTQFGAVTAILVPEGIRYGIGWVWDGTTVSDPTPPPPPVIPESITRRQCAKAMFQMGLITGQEAVDMTRNGLPPAMVQGYFAALSDGDRFTAEIDFAADTYLRSNSLLNTLMSAVGKQPSEVDQFFIAAATL